ncbi:FG-GAP-like repeat-containing protein [Flavobacterium sp.]|uniref:FG-GAP-like repeat-containing protein n=1 Tax=Flavobacterium sp. TaxID=239 RepID=UPI0025BFF5E5|nr:FG-GAP-like repeat-containing protein [Flavobacterium sp.]
MKKITLLTIFLLKYCISYAQDTCLTAPPIAQGFYTVTTVNGSQLPTPICFTSAVNPTAAEWYTYTPSSNFNVTITTDIAANTPRVDTRINVYNGTCNNLNCYANDDDSGANYSSVVNFVATAGTTYYIAWDNRWTSNGFTFQLIENTYTPPLPNPINYISQTITTVNSTYNICIVDMNNDYKDDIVGVSANNLRVHNQTTPGNFSISDFPITGTSDMPSWSLAAGDFNRDGFNDLVLGSGSGLTFWKSNSTGTAYTNINPTEYIFCQRTNFVDINNDGNLDAFSCHDVAPNVYYLNNSSNTFTHFQSGVTPGSYNLGTLSSGGNYASIWTDYDNDGDVDLFISKCSGPPCELHRNDGNGVFTNISAIAQINTTPVQSWSSAIADFDNDGDMDIFVGANGNSGHKYFLNNLDTSNNTEEAFTNITASTGIGTDTSISRDYIAYDFDNDGKVDIMGGGNKIFFNQGNNNFAPTNYTGMSLGAIGDLNNDGYLDIANNNKIFYAIPNGNNWIKISLQGIQSNRNGIGARIEVYGVWGKQIRDVRSGEGFEFMSTLNTHFGIGTATQISQIIIKWPSGTIDIINNPNPNQTLHVIEGNYPLSQATFDNNLVKIYPNPASSILQITNIDKLSLKSIKIYSTNGKMIKEIISNFETIQISELQEGMYILSIETTEGRKFAESFIKKK